MTNTTNLRARLTNLDTVAPEAPWSDDLLGDAETALDDADSFDADAADLRAQIARLQKALAKAETKATTAKATAVKCMDACDARLAN